VCGVQEYERSLFGFAVKPLCERENDEWGSYAGRRRNGGVCAQTFVTATTSPHRARPTVRATQRLHLPDSIRRR